MIEANAATKIIENFMACKTVCSSRTESSSGIEGGTVSDFGGIKAYFCVEMPADLTVR